MESDKDVKVEENRSAGCCSGHHGLKVLFILVVIFVVFAGIAGVAKLAFLLHNFSNQPFARDINIEKSGFGQRMMGDGWGMHQNIGSSLIGIITKIDGDKLTMHKDSNNKDYIIKIIDTSQITKDGDIAAKSDLAIGQAVTIRGKSNSDGQIVASRMIIN